MKNFSKQRETILETLRQTDCHPTAAWIYEHAKEKLPNLSLGTVYRNLAQLAENGDIICFSAGGSTERYDGCNSDHLHFYCESCNTILDLMEDSGLKSMVEERLGCEIKTSAIVFSGTCQDCRSLNE